MLAVLMLIVVGGSSGIVVEGDKQRVKDTLCDKLEEVVVVLSTGEWVHMEHVITGIEGVE